MSNTTKHKVIAKFGNDLIDLKDVPYNVRNLWNRHNFDWGYYKNIRQLKNKKFLDKELTEQLND